MELLPTPFETEMIRDAAHFVGRWHDVQSLVQAVDRRTLPVLCAAPQSGRSSLLFHIVAAAAVLFEHDDIPAYYIDVATFPDLESVQETIAAAFAVPGTPWQRAILSAPTAPLLALDNIDAPQHDATQAAWLAELAQAVTAGQLRVIACAQQTYNQRAPCVRVGMSAVNQSFLSEYLDVMLPDGPIPSRADQHYMLTIARGHLGTLITVLVLWYQSLQEHDFDWQARALGLQQRRALQVDQESDQPAMDSADRVHGHATSAREAVEETSPQLPAGVTVPSGWWVLVAFVVLVVALYAWGR